MTETLYVTRNGLLEPLGQSQVYGYLRGLSRQYRITLITFEKEADLADPARVAAVRADCLAHGIDWRPQRFYARPKGIAPALAMLRLIWLLLRLIREKQAALIHARSYVPAAVALLVSRLTGVPFLFDMRALWPEELITAGRLRRGSVLHKAIVWAERACLARAGAVVVLTHAAADHLRRLYPAELARQTVAIIPTCVDLDRFTPAATPPAACVIGCLGTLQSGWFRLDLLTAFLQTAAGADPAARFDIITQDNPQVLRATLDPDAQLGPRLVIRALLPRDVPAALHAQTASVFFYAGGQVSELGRSPTRMAEILASGLPVVTNSGVGDVARIVQRYRVGVLVETPEPQAMAAAWADLQTLLQDKDLPSRCRQAAEEVFSLPSGTTAYADLYAQLSTRGSPCVD